MVCGDRNESDINMSLIGNTIEQVNQLKYLWTVITNDGRSKNEIKCKIGQGEKG